MAVSLISSVSDILFAMLFFSKPPADRHGSSGEPMKPPVVSGPQFEKAELGVTTSVVPGTQTTAESIVRP
jgi:hypothetical protein